MSGVESPALDGRRDMMPRRGMSSVAAVALIGVAAAALDYHPPPFRHYYLQFVHNC